MEGPQLVTKEPTPPKILIFHSPPLQKIRGDHTYQLPVLPTHKQLYASLTPRQQEHFLKQTQLYIRMFCTGLCGFTFILLLCISPMPWVQFLMAENGLELYAGLWTPCEHELCWSNVPSRPYYLQISRIFFLFSNLTAFTILLCVISSCRHKKNFISGLDRVIAILCLISGANLFFCLVLFLMQVKKYTSYTMGSSYLWIFHFNWWGSFFYIVAGLISFINYKTFGTLPPDLDVTEIPLTRRLGIHPKMWSTSATKEDPQSEMVVDPVEELEFIGVSLEKKNDNKVNSNK
ncbi:transmembrane protein 202 [Macrotis lagotis]|uniref:transmembrane protein 202 n=1 Tax=Macrotis lagotis TaxID=92651 RepID=UPI003D69BE67